MTGPFARNNLSGRKWRRFDFGIVIGKLFPLYSADRVIQISRERDSTRRNFEFNFAYYELRKSFPTRGWSLNNLLFTIKIK